jgi:hypothetical protein
MNKKLAFALPLALSVPFAASASTVNIDGTSGGTSKTVSTSTNTLTNLRTGASADIQVSAGVILQMQDGSFSNPDVGGNDIAVTSCHEGGNAAYFGETGGGSVLKNANFGTNNCETGKLGWSNVANT